MCWFWRAWLLRYPILAAGCIPTTLFLVFISGLFLAGQALQAASPSLPPPLLGRMTERYGEGARTRLLEWQTLLQRQRGVSEQDRLLRVNRFLNRIPFATDSEHWGQVDYWATPAEFLASNGGDCEDFAIAKLFTLQAMGVPANKLRLMYVKALALDQPHMVLLYIKEEGSAPLVLDNLINEILPAQNRTDLEPVYSFNAGGLWLNRPAYPDRKVRDHSNSLLWRDLVERIRHEGFH